MTEDPASWVGRQRIASDPMDPFAARALIAALELDRSEPREGDPLPPFWHWMHFLDPQPRSQLGPDGHYARGQGMTPPVPQIRRMWAGGRFEVLAPLPLGTRAERVSTIAAITPKEGKAGSMSFLTMTHEVTGGAGLAFREEQDIVYRDDPAPDAPRREPPRARTDESRSREWSCDPTVLFRYSALTYNGHRIHYDRDHAMKTEGYPGLVVHGPLLALLLLELARDVWGGESVRRFNFRATAPVFDLEVFETCAAESGTGLDLWVRGADGRQAMVATAER